MEQRGLGEVDPAPDFDDGILQVKPRDYIAQREGPCSSFRCASSPCLPN